ncbi:hypothetical protein FJZ36_11970 [Candidatus Poribacteria bacterium]|nr:hypothetical protein [Candidatus Poribacteria bacterium]
MPAVNTAVIPVAGYGTRLYPATKAVPKALMPVIDRDGLLKPVLQLLIGEALSAGVELVVIVTQPEQKAAIARYFTEPPPGPIRDRDDIQRLVAEAEQMRPHLLFVAQESAEGFGHAVFCARDFVRRGPVLVMVGDHIFRVPPGTPTCAAQAVGFFEKYGRSVVGVERVGPEWVDALALISGEPIGDNQLAYRVDTLKEKPGIEQARAKFRLPTLPPNTWLGTFGIDVLTPHIFDILDYNFRNDIRSRGEVQLRDAMETLVLLEGMVAGIIEGERLDMGTPEAWAQTCVKLFRDSLIGDRALA